MKFAVLRSYTGNPALVIKYNEYCYSILFLHAAKDLFIQNKIKNTTFIKYDRSLVEEHFDLTNVEFLTREELLILENDKF